MSCTFDVEATASLALCTSLTGDLDDLDARACPARTWLELCAELLACPPSRFPAERVARLLCTTFQARVCSFSLSVQDTLVGGIVRSDIGVTCHTVSGPDDAGGGTPAPWSRELSHACPDRLSLPSRLSATSTVAFVVGRDGAFRAAENRLAETLSPVLTAVDARVRAAQATQPIPAPEALPLTSREAAVLTLLGEGLTAVAIAHRLTISTRTVHKHLERIYTKLNVTDRLAATRAGRQMGLIVQ